MAAYIQSQTFAKTSCLSHPVLRKTSSANASKLHTYPFVLNPNISVRRLPQNFCPSAHLKASSSSSKWTFEKMATQRRALQNRRMAFAGEATAGNAAEEPKHGKFDYSRPFRVIEAPPNAFGYLPWIAGFAILVFVFRNLIVRELVYWLKPAVLGLDFLINKVIVVLYTLLKPLVPLAAVVTTGTAWAIDIVKCVHELILILTSVQGFTEAIVLSSAVFGIGEATKANAVSSQPYTILLAGFLGLGAVLRLLSSAGFVVLLLALVSFSLKVKKKDMVSSIMPVAAVLTVVAEPWVRAFSMASFLAIAIHQNWKSPEKEHEPLDNDLRCTVQPIIIILRVLSLMVGITVAGKWLYLRHLIWLSK